MVEVDAAAGRWHAFAAKGTRAGWFEPRSGERRALASPLRGEAGEALEKPDSRGWLLWLRPE